MILLKTLGWLAKDDKRKINETDPQLTWNGNSNLKSTAVLLTYLLIVDQGLIMRNVAHRKPSVCFRNQWLTKLFCSGLSMLFT